MSITALLLITSFVLAGGGPIEFSVDPAGPLSPGEQYVVNVRVYTDGPPYPNFCKNCYLKLGLMNPQDEDYIAQSSDTTDLDGRLYAKVISKVGGTRTIYAIELRDSNGVKITANSTRDLKYNGAVTPTSTNLPMPGAPEMVYPADRQELDLEGAYMFKVKPVERATGYLFGLFQDGVMVYENWGDGKYLSSNGEFALWENNPYHARFHNGDVKVMIRALVNNQWTDGNTRYNVFVKKTGGQGWEKQLIGEWGPSAELSIRSDAEYYVKVEGCKNLTTNCADSSASAALQQRINELENKLQQSQQKQSALEQRLNQIISWIKSLFPFFK